MAVTTIHSSFASQTAQTTNVKKDSVTNHKAMSEKSFDDLIQAIRQFKLGYQTRLPDRNPPISSTESIERQPISDPFRSSSTYSVRQSRSERLKKLLADPIIELKQLKETDGIEDYHAKFGVLSTRVNLSEDSLVSIFLDGLWADTRMNTQMFNPKTIQQCLLVGRLYERVHQKKSTIGQLVNTKGIKDTAKAAEFIQVNDDLSGITEDNETIKAEMMQKEETNPTVWSAKEDLIGIQEAKVNISQVNLIQDMVMEEATSIPAAEEVMGVGDTNYNSEVTRAEMVKGEVTSHDKVVVGTAITRETQPHQHKVSENPCFSVVTMENDSLLAKTDGGMNGDNRVTKSHDMSDCGKVTDVTPELISSGCSDGEMFVWDPGQVETSMGLEQSSIIKEKDQGINLLVPDIPIGKDLYVSTSSCNNDGNDDSEYSSHENSRLADFLAHNRVREEMVRIDANVCLLGEDGCIFNRLQDSFLSTGAKSIMFTVDHIENLSSSVQSYVEFHPLRPPARSSAVTVASEVLRSCPVLKKKASDVVMLIVRFINSGDAGSANISCLMGSTIAGGIGMFGYQISEVKNQFVQFQLLQHRQKKQKSFKTYMFKYKQTLDCSKATIHSQFSVSSRVRRIWDPGGVYFRDFVI